MGKRNNFGIISLAVFSSITTTLVCLAVLGLIFYHAFWDVTYIDISKCPKEMDAKVCISSRNWDSSTYLAIITDFYSTIVTVLIAALGILGIFAFLVIRGAARQQAEQEVEAEVDRFFKTINGQDQIRKSLEETDRTGIRKMKDQIMDIISILEENDILVETTLEVKKDAE